MSKEKEKTKQKLIRPQKITETTMNLGSGDSCYIKDFMDEEETYIALNQYKYHGAADWKQSTIKGGPVPRQISVQGDVDSETGTVPIYRHPSDSYMPMVPWTETTKKIKNKAEKQTNSVLNHGVIQLYRDGKDYISDHTDKTLDIKIGTSIACVNLGETRLLVFKKKDKTKIQEITLVSGSIYIIGWKTNIEWTHGIRRMADPNIKVSERIGISFRTIATFLRQDGRMFGQGAKFDNEKELDDYMDDESSWMQRTFHQMNQSDDVHDPIFYTPRKYDITTLTKFLK